jgi:hypothetical protein
VNAEVDTDIAYDFAVAPLGRQPHRFGTPPPPQVCVAGQLVGHVMVVPHAVTIPHHVGSHAHPQRFGWVLPHVCPFEHVPHDSLPPQPSSISPQLAFIWLHVRCRQPSGPAS